MSLCYFQIQSVLIRWRGGTVLSSCLTPMRSWVWIQSVWSLHSLPVSPCIHSRYCCFLPQLKDRHGPWNLQKESVLFHSYMWNPNPLGSVMRMTATRQAQQCVTESVNNEISLKCERVREHCSSVCFGHVSEIYQQGKILARASTPLHLLRSPCWQIGEQTSE